MSKATTQSPTPPTLMRRITTAIPPTPAIPPILPMSIHPMRPTTTHTATIRDIIAIQHTIIPIIITTMIATATTLNIITSIIQIQ